MPLDTKGERGRVRNADRFDHAIIADGLNEGTGGWPIDSLSMQRIDHYFISPIGEPVKYAAR